MFTILLPVIGSLAIFDTVGTWPGVQGEPSGIVQTLPWCSPMRRPPHPYAPLNRTQTESIINMFFLCLCWVLVVWAFLCLTVVEFIVTNLLSTSFLDTVYIFSFVIESLLYSLQYYKQIH